MLTFQKKNKRRGIVPVVVIASGFFIGLAGNFALKEMTGGQPIEVYTAEGITGQTIPENWYRDVEIKSPAPVQAPNEQYLKEIELLRKDIIVLQEKLSSRGEVNREEAFKKEKVIAAIDKNLGGAFKGKSHFIYSTSKSYNVNPMLVSAIIKHETHNGTSQVCIIGNNPGGLIWYDGCPYKKYGIFIHYPSLDKGIEDMVRQLKTFYIDKGLKTIEKIQKVYCPEGASNDPNGLNVNWLPAVTKYYLEILEDAQ